jgi:hypothetical protein
VHSALGHQPRALCEECSSRRQGPKGGQTPKSSIWENCARFFEAPEPKGCIKPCWYQECPDFSDPCRLEPRCCWYFSKAKTSRVPRSASPESLVRWTWRNRWAATRRRVIRASVHRTTVMVFACHRVLMGQPRICLGQISCQLIWNSSCRHRS